jgi:hypothetical protein
MTTSPKSSSLLKAAPLWAKSSVKGGQYLTGRLGAMKILIRENRDRQGDDEPSHHLFFTEVPDRRQGAQERGDGVRAPQPPRTGQRPSDAPRSDIYGQGQRTPDHQTLLDIDDVPEWAR